MWHAAAIKKPASTRCAGKRRDPKRIEKSYVFSSSLKTCLRDFGRFFSRLEPSDVCADVCMLARWTTMTSHRNVSMRACELQQSHP